ncbi:MAG: DUF454 domain-containing protein [Hyphomicrobiaceae bacterium]|nr:MAG: DUF454 domain-containing protein [Hyphomicrobiaceae bacterium]
MQRLILVVVGSISTALAIAGALLPGLPTTPFVIVALWAFARSSETLYSRVQRIPLLGSALAEAHRFEKERAIRAPVKITALSFAWGSVLLTAATTGGSRPVLLSLVAMAAVAGTFFMWWIPTERQ